MPSKCVTLERSRATIRPFVTPKPPPQAAPAGAGARSPGPKKPGAPAAATRRSILSVDLGGLKEPLEARSAATGVKPSAWVREALQRALAGSGDASAVPADPRGVDAGRGPGVYRAWFDADQTAKLDLIVARTGRRSRIKALHALLDGVQLGAEASAVNVADAVQALARSNHELVAVGRNLNQVAKTLNAFPGKTTVADRMAIERVLATARGHLEVAARLVAELRPLVKSQADSEAQQSKRKVKA